MYLSHMANTPRLKLNYEFENLHRHMREVKQVISYRIAEASVHYSGGLTEELCCSIDRALRKLL